MNGNDKENKHCVLQAKCFLNCKKQQTRLMNTIRTECTFGEQELAIGASNSISNALHGLYERCLVGREEPRLCKTFLENYHKCVLKNAV